MYLSRITLLPHAAQDPAFWAMFREAYATHQEVWRWAGGGPDAQRDFLYRVDETDTGLPQVLILGTRPARAPENLWRSESKIWAPRLEVGQRLGFTLRANAVVRHGAERHDVVLHAKKLAAAAGQPPGSEADRTQETGERWLRAQGAKRLNLTVKQAVEKAKAAGLPVKDGSALITKEQASKIKESI